MSSKYSIKCNFSARHKEQQSIFVFPLTFSIINRLILYDIFASFNDHIYFYNSVFLLCCLWLKSSLWFPNHSLKVFAASTKYTLLSLLTYFQHLLYILQLHPYLLILDWSNKLFCPAFTQVTQDSQWK